MSNYPRGSEWRRWDLHLHTPGTVKNDNFSGSSTDEKWGQFNKDVNEYGYDVSVVGITDYLSIVNYSKFNQLCESGAITKHFDLILPNVELRIQPVGASGSPVNIHCIFNPAIVEQLEDRFFAKLIIPLSDDSFSASRGELIRLGRKHQRNQNLDEQTAYVKGVEQFVIPFNIFKDLFEKDKELRKNTFIVVSNRDHDGASGITKHSDFFANPDDSQLDSTRWDIYQFADCIFSSNDADRTYFSANGVDDEETIRSKCGNLMPCIHGCDAHSNDKIFEPDDKRYCWIKSDPTFEGLKQIKYEPTERVRIGEIKPDIKSEYLVIDKVRFIDDSFDPKEILINQNLTTIIGGKSTGKSILLRSIASSIDGDEVKKRLDEAGIPDYDNPISGFEVVWKDGQSNKLNELHDAKRIIYFPQSYLNRLIDKKEDVTSIDEIIKNVLLQDSVIKEEFKKIEDFERNNKLEIAKLIEDLFFARDDLEKQSLKIKTIGDLKGIQEVVSKTEKEIVVLREKAGISKDEADKFRLLSKSISDSKTKLNIINSDLEILESIQSDYPRPSFNNDGMSEALNKSVQDIIEKIRKSTEEIWTKDVLFIKKSLIKEKEELEKSIKKTERELNPIQVKVEKLTFIKDKNSYLDKEKGKLIIITNEIGKFKGIQNRIEGIIEKLQKIHSSYYEFYNQSKAIVLNQKIIKDDLSFDLKIVYRRDHFQKQFVEDMCNLKTLSNFKDINLTNFNFDSISNYSNNIGVILRGILSGGLILKSNFSKKEALIKLLQNWFLFDFQVIHSGDDIASMSSGKKSFVILKLLVELDQSQCPILLDQPEDDLDNRSIYSELVKFIREKKKERQIIVVTHNPNLVVGADSEEVIVANQNGKETKNSTFKFEYISGSLENSYANNEIEEILLKRGIQEHVCEILEGGKAAFEQRENRYGAIN